MSNTITNRPLNNERFAVTGHSILAVKPHSNPTGPTYKHDWTEWFSTKEAAQKFMDTKAAQSTPTAAFFPEKLHELDAKTAEQLSEEEAGAILNA